MLVPCVVRTEAGREGGGVSTMCPEGSGRRPIRVRSSIFRTDTPVPRTRSMSTVVIWLLIVAVVGAAAASFGTVALAGCLRRGWHAVCSAEAIVVGHLEHEDAEGTTYPPVVAFTWEGRERRVVGSTGRAGSPETAPGQRVRVYVPPGRPDEATIAAWRGLG